MNSALFLDAVSRNDLIQIKAALTDNRVDINVVNNRHQTALHLATLAHYVCVVALLITHQIDANIKDAEGKIALSYAAGNGNLEIVKQLLPISDINSQDFHKQTPLYWTVARYDETKSIQYNTILDLLLSRPDCNVYALDKTKSTALYWAATNGYQYAVERLLSKMTGDKLSTMENSALVTAAHNGHVKIVRLLLNSFKFNVNYQNRLGMTALARSVILGNIDIVQDLLKFDADPNLLDTNGRSALYWAGKNYKVVKELLHNKMWRPADPNVKDKFGKAPLHWAVINKYVDTIKVFLEYSSTNVNIQDNYKKTPLHLAAEIGDLTILELFLSHPRIQTTIKDIQGKLPIHLAAEHVISSTQPYQDAVMLLMFEEIKKEGIMSNPLNDEHWLKSLSRQQVNTLNVFKMYEAYVLFYNRYYDADLRDVEWLRTLTKRQWNILLEIPETYCKRTRRDVLECNHDGNNDNNDDTISTEQKLNLEYLPRYLKKLNYKQRRLFTNTINQYNLQFEADHYFTGDIENYELAIEYQQAVVNFIKSNRVLTPECLSEISWHVYEHSFNKYHSLSPDLRHKVITTLKKIYSQTSVQALFFIPDLIRAMNKKQPIDLVKMAGLLTTDLAINYSYKTLLDKLIPFLEESRIDLLHKLPVTSPVFKALTIYSIVELTDQLENLPPNSEQRQTIKHHLIEQYVTVSLLVIETLGIEVTPLWISLIAEQLIFDTFTFRKHYQLVNVSFWEAFLMNLGFEQDTMHHILEERHFVDFNFELINKINAHALVPYGWIIVNVPLLSRQSQWVRIDENAVPLEIKKHIPSQPVIISSSPSIDYYFGLSFSKYIKSIQFIKELADYRLVSVAADTSNNTNPLFSNLDAIGSSLLQRQSVWYKKVYKIIPHQYKLLLTSLASLTTEVESNIFLNITNYQRMHCSGLTALYLNKQLNANKKELYFEYDPREGSINIQFDAASDLLGDNNAKSFTLTVHINSKLYPPNVLFELPPSQNNTFVFNPSCSSNINTVYVINSNAKQFTLIDSSNITSIYIISLHDKFKIWSSNHILHLQSATQQTSKINFEYYKKYLEIIFTRHHLLKHVVLSAEEINLVDVVGEDAYRSSVTFNVTARFSVLMLGNIQIKDGETILYCIGPHHLNNSRIQYTKIHINNYQLHVGNFSLLPPSALSFQKIDYRHYRISILKDLRFIWMLANTYDVLQLTGFFSGVYVEETIRGKDLR